MTGARSAELAVRETGNTHGDGERDFDELIAEHSTTLYRYARMMCGDDSNAQDLVQETLIRAWRSLHKLNEPAAAKGWLLRILRNENARRFARRQLPIVNVPAESLVSAQPSYDTSTEAFALRRALVRLDAKYREPLLMQFIYGFSLEEISKQLGLSAAGVGTQVFRARQKLREMLQEC